MTNILKEIREKKGMSVLELSRSSGVTRQTIYNIEKNKSASVSPETMEALSKALKVKASSIFLI